MDCAHLGALLACTAYLCLSRMSAKGRNAFEQLPQAAKLPAQGQGQEPVNKQSRSSQLPTELPASPEARPAIHSSTLLSEPDADQPPARAAEPGVTRQAVAPQEPTANRRGYRVPAYIAPYRDDLAAIANYERVFCHELSQTGVSFIRRDPLASGGQLIVTLSQKNAPTIYMVASVVYSRPIIVRGDELYRISCRFIRRLESTSGPSS